MADQPDEQFSRKKQTLWLSAEFIITMLLQTGVFLVVGTTAINRVDARVTALEAQQVTDGRIARMEEKLGMVVDNQKDFRKAITELQAQIQSQRVLIENQQRR